VLRIQRALLGEVLLLFGLISAGVTGALFVGGTLRFVNEGGGALGGDLLLDLVPNLLPVAFGFSLPFAWLTAVTVTLGRWVADHECTAVKSLGIHLRAIVLPITAVSALLGVSCMAYHGYVVPRVHREVRSVLKEAVPVFLASLRGPERSIVLGNGRLSFDHYDPQEHAFLGVELDRRGPKGHLEEKAIMRRLRLEQMQEREDGQTGLVMDLGDAWILSERGGEAQVEGWRRDLRFVMGRVEQAGGSTLFNEFFGTSRWSYKPKDMTLPELAYVVERDGVARGGRKAAAISLHGRLVYGAAIFFLGVFATAAALLLPPTGRRVRDFLVCFLPAVLAFFPLHLASFEMARKGPLPLELVMWLPNLALLAGAVGLLLVAFRR
jgi:lipopolysaccharide export LptBFGC system permease protein LptF